MSRRSDGKPIDYRELSQSEMEDVADKVANAAIESSEERSKIIEDERSASAGTRNPGLELSSIACLVAEEGAGESERLDRTFTSVEILLESADLSLRSFIDTCFLEAYDSALERRIGSAEIESWYQAGSAIGPLTRGLLTDIRRLGSS